MNPTAPVQRTVLACALICSLGACTLPKKAPTDADLAGEPGGTVSAPRPPTSPNDASDPHPPMAPKPAPQTSVRPAAVTPPQALVRPAPAYPAALRADGMEGRVVVRYTVDASGRAHDLQIVQASHPLFAQEVRAALARWRFEPARDASGKAVAASAQQSFQFRLQD